MSLKARVTLAIALLMSAMVMVLSVLYLRGFLETAFSRTHGIADSLGNSLQAAILDELKQKTLEANPPSAEAQEFWLHTVETDPVIAHTLQRALRQWHLVSELLITDSNDRIRASAIPHEPGRKGQVAPDLAEWTNRSVLDNFRQVYWGPPLTEILRPIAIVGEKTPILNIHVVISTIFIREEVTHGLWTVAWVCLACLGASLALALIVPSVILSPLERLGRNIDRMATGKFPSDAQPQKEAKEFAAVYSKLNALGQQYIGAQESVDQWRGNVEQMLERLEEAVLLFDAGGRLTMAGRAVGRLLDREPGAFVGQTARDIFGTTSGIGILVDEAIDRGVPIHDRVAAIDTGSETRSLVVSIQPLTRAHSGPRMGTLVTLRDAETRGELAAHLDMAGRLTALSHLTRGIAHEIKNPLNAIALHLEILRSRLNDDMPEVAVISQEISRLDRVVKTFLDFNRPVQPRLVPIDLSDMARDVAQLVAPDAQSRNIRVEVRSAPGPAMVNADRDLLNQAILNVVVNAVEAMSSGGTLDLETRRDRGCVELIVSDTGPGIPHEVQDKIFDLYFSTKKNGSGIGLAMAFRFVQLLDGRIDFSSEAGRGTTFRFEFPEAASPTQKDLELSRSQGA